MKARLVSVHVGRIRTHGTPGATDPLERQWSTAYFKDPVEGPRHLGLEGLEGDEQRDYGRGHGGPEMAALMYSADHYPAWREELQIPEMSFGGFGENLVVEGLEESSVCIGDTFEVGEAIVQISCPRGPCSNIAKRWHRPDMVKRVTANGRTGWYLRVKQEGLVAAGDDLTLTDRPNPLWTVARVFRARVEPERDPAAVRELTELPLLDPVWHGKFRKLAAALTR